jgi:CheY-like chemotaxis protein
MPPEIKRDEHPRQLRFLVVEDNEDDREFLMRQLRKANVEERAVFATDVRGATDIFAVDSERSIFAVFLDLHLRDGSGLDVLKELRSCAATKQLPVFVLTGSTNPADVEKCAAFGVMGYLQKPVAFAEFCRAIASTFHLPSNVATV